MPSLPHRLRLLPLLCAATSSLLANGGGYVTGLNSTGAFKPLNVGQVQMLTEHLEIDLHIEYADVRIEYLLYNPGAKITVEAGFPSARPLDFQDNPSTTQATLDSALMAQAELQGFELSADGRPLKATHRPDHLRLPLHQEPGIISGDGKEVTSWHIFRLDFDRGQKRRLQVHYRNPYHGLFEQVSIDYMANPLTFTYLFSSAASWSGPIKEGTVQLRAMGTDPNLVQLSHPKRFQRDGSTWTWQFTGFKPTLEDDLTITVRPGYSGQFEEVHRSKEDTVANEYRTLGWGDKGSRLREAKPKGLWELRRFDYAAKASSTLPPGEIQPHDAKLLASHNPHEGGWVTGGSGDGVGESVTLTLPTPAKVRRIGLINGHRLSKDSYEDYNRVAELGVSVDGGAPVNVVVPDEYLTHEEFGFDLPVTKGLVKSVKLTIAKIYKGSRYNHTALGQVDLIVPLDKEPPTFPCR